MQGFYWVHVSNQPVIYAGLAYYYSSPSHAIIVGVPGPLPGATNAYHGFLMGSGLVSSPNLRSQLINCMTS
jgi:hypothetical protein